MRTVAKICRTCGGGYIGRGQSAHCPPCVTEKNKPRPDRQCVACDSSMAGCHPQASYCKPCKLMGTRIGRDCKACGEKLPDARLRYCAPCKPPPVVKVIEPRPCTICAVPIVGRHRFAKYCNDCAGRKRDPYRPNNGNEQARLITKYAVRIGFLPPCTDFKCVHCKRVQAQCYDHRDYNKPLSVDPVCLRCNSRRGKGVAVHLPARATVNA